MRDQYWRSGEGFICVFAVDNLASFEEFEGYIAKIRQIKDSNDIPIILVGNKVDLVNRRVVCTKDASRYASMLFFETSAKTGLCVAEVFTAIVHEICHYKSRVEQRIVVKQYNMRCCVLL